MSTPEFNESDITLTILQDSSPEAQEMRAVLVELVGQQRDGSGYFPKLTSLPAYQAARAQDVAYRGRLVRATATAYARSYKKWGAENIRRALAYLLEGLFRTKLALTQADYLFVFDKADFNLAKSSRETFENFYRFPILLALSQVANLAQNQGLSPQMRVFLEKLLNFTTHFLRELDAVQVRVQEILGRDATKGMPVLLIAKRDILGKGMWDFVASLNPDSPATLHWLQLLELWQQATTSQPSAKLRQELDAATATLGANVVREQGRAWLELLTLPTTQPRAFFANYFDSYAPTNYCCLVDANSVLDKGLVWTMQPLADADILARLTTIATCGVGDGLGNACLLALAKNGLPGMAALTRVRSKTRQSNTLALIARHITQEAAQLGVSSAEVEDLSVPDFDFKNGRLAEELGEYTATLTLTGGKVELSWQKGDKPLKSAPAALKASHPYELKALKATHTAIQQTYTALRDRLDRSFTEGRRIAGPWFEQYYLHHELMRELVRPLIWRLHQPDGGTQDAIYQADAWQDAQGQPVPAPTAETELQLWHPVLAPAGQVVAWRQYLETKQLRQPLKQAYREVYLLTPPEERTATYSNRMAAHILKQHQFNSLAKLRGWRYNLLSTYDASRTTEAATLQLPAHDLTADFLVGAVAVEGEWNGSQYKYVSTDQVRFGRNYRLVPLPEIPPLVFSEVMRDVDLFVGVASVGNDPEWRDNGGLGQYRAYWERYSFGDLGEVAKNRRLALERLVPRLKIGKVSEIKGNFLEVTGKRHVYKIHLGSGNILMAPNDQYLCIVPDQATKTLGTGSVFLPFEGDELLSIILSKALLLMEDDKITDQTILRQL
ncbi:DUF4132 domain-containing protein [Hymenobacter sp. H14-R3]|uniref:DUF4132 domain-containing protein n=1 Tax=Hymenobacter sp. H14-R3 TaxID=3046308 RepID=UPI0024B91DDA|nr:DUF4132 domain-containing protein [Hymenobacter sp. H14-R3]MDJ0364732.1 DUF4132 domain-containing protein [Hymenobacter sp. H14-R3]